MNTKLGPIGSDKGGFSLVEINISTVILAMVMAGCYGMVNQSLYMMRSARDHYLASSIAHNRLERMNTFSVQELPLMQESSVLINEHGEPDPQGRFRRTSTIDTHSGLAARVTVQVEIRGLRSGSFDGQQEAVSTRMADLPERGSS